MTVFEVNIPGNASPARVLAVLKDEFSESQGISVKEIERNSVDTKKKDEEIARLMSAIETAYKQRKELLAEVSVLRQKYERQKTSLLSTLWLHCSPNHPDLANIPPIPEDPVKETPDAVDRYIFTDFLGEGQFASVKGCILADGTTTATALAVKIIKKDKVASFSAIKRLSSEIEALKTLRSKHTLAIYDVIQTQVNLYIVMEKGGQDLFTFFDFFSQGVPELIGKEIALRIILAVAHCHKHKFCHLDLKPENILIVFDNTTSKILSLKLCDFGMCSKFEKDEARRDFCGSPGFFAPEMLIQRKYYGDKADVWSVGCILLELFVGHQKFADNWMHAYNHEGLKDGDMFARAITSAVYGLPRILQISSDLQNMIMKLFVLEPADRPMLSDMVMHICFDELIVLRSELDSLDVSTSGVTSGIDSFEDSKTLNLVKIRYFFFVYPLVSYSI